MRSHIEGPLLKLSVNHLLVQWDLFSFSGVTLLQTNQMTFWIIIPSYRWDLTFKGPFQNWVWIIFLYNETFSLLVVSLSYKQTKWPFEL